MSDKLFEFPANKLKNIVHSNATTIQSGSMTGVRARPTSPQVVMTSKSPEFIYFGDQVFVKNGKGQMASQVTRRIKKRTNPSALKNYSSAGVFENQTDSKFEALQKRPNSITQEIKDDNIRKELEWIKDQCVGAGAFSKVYRGSSQFTNRVVAMKIIALTSDEGVPSSATREISHLKNLIHPNVIKIIDYHLREKELRIILEYMPDDLYTFMKSRDDFLSMEDVQLLSIQLFRGLEYIHRKKVMHRDIKPQNLLINEAMELKIADFGLARSSAVPLKELSADMATLWYRPLDLLLNRNDYSFEIDLWSAGCVLFEIFSKNPLIPGFSKENQIAKLVHYLGFPSDEHFPGLSTDLNFREIMLNFYQKNYDLSYERAVSHLSSVFKYSRRTYFAEKIDQKVFRLILQRRNYNSEDETFKNFIDLTGKCLRIKSSLRISAREALKHPFFKKFLGSIDLEKLEDTESFVKAYSAMKEKARISIVVTDCNKILEHYARSVSRHTSNNIKTRSTIFSS